MSRAERKARRSRVRRQSEAVQNYFVRTGLKKRLNVAYLMLHSPQVQGALKQAVVKLGLTVNDTDKVAELATETLKICKVNLDGIRVTAIQENGRMILRADADPIEIRGAYAAAKETELRAV